MDRMLIAKLAKEADFEVCEDGFVWEAGIGEMTYKMEDFAKLIVKECNNRISKWETAHIDKNGKIHYGEIGKDIVEDINQYFGISQ